MPHVHAQSHCHTTLLLPATTTKTQPQPQPQPACPSPDATLHTQLAQSGLMHTITGVMTNQVSIEHELGSVRVSVSPDLLLLVLGGYASFSINEAWLNHTFSLTTQKRK